MTLCNANALPSAMGTGCNFDEERVWTSSSPEDPDGRAEPLALEPGPVLLNVPTAAPTQRVSDVPRYKYCGHEGETCTCRGYVVYGRRYHHGKPGHGQRETYARVKGSGDYKIKKAYGEISCTNDVFGDPLQGWYKQCFCKTDLNVVPTRAPTVSVKSPPSPPPPPPPPSLVKSPVTAAAGDHSKFYSSPAFISVLCGVGMTGLGGLALLAWRAYSGDGAKVGDTQYQRVNTDHE